MLRQSALNQEFLTATSRFDAVEVDDSADENRLVDGYVFGSEKEQDLQTNETCLAMRFICIGTAPCQLQRSS